MGYDIVRHSDYVIYDSDFNVVEFPKDMFDYGTRGESIEIGHVPNNVQTERVGDRIFIREVSTDDREISITFQVFGKTRHDYEIKERILWRFFRELDEFYIAKGTASNVLYRVKLNGKIDMNKVNYLIPYAQAIVPLIKVDIDYGVSRFKTLDLHHNKIQFDGKWSFGMNLEGWENSEKLKYIFNQNEPIEFYNASDLPSKNISNPDCIVRIKVKSPTTKFTLYDDEGNTFIYNNKNASSDALKNGDVLVLQGSKIELNGRNVLSKTNKRFLEMNIGMNKWQILEDFEYEIEFDFRFIYE